MIDLPSNNPVQFTNTSFSFSSSSANTSPSVSASNPFLFFPFPALPTFPSASHIFNTSNAFPQAASLASCLLANGPRSSTSISSPSGPASCSRTLHPSSMVADRST